MMVHPSLGEMGGLMFWKMILAHLLTDFVLQPDWMHKNKGKKAILALHGSVFLILCLAFFNRSLNTGLIVGLVVVAVTHVVVDFIKIKIQAKERGWGGTLFLLDQGLHLIAIAVFVLVFDKYEVLNFKQQLTDALSQTDIFLLLSFPVLIVWGGGYFTATICRGFIPQDKEVKNPGIANAGRYIGMLERTLVLIAVLVGRFEIIGFLLAAKSIVRHPEMKDDPKFAEYFLIGTLTSVSWAVLGSLAFLKLIAL